MGKTLWSSTGNLLGFVSNLRRWALMLSPEVHLLIIYGYLLVLTVAVLKVLRDE